MVRPIGRLVAVLAALACAFVLSCAGAPPPSTAGAKTAVAITPQADTEPAPTAPPSFNPVTVTAETKNATFTDIRALIDSLNQIIRRQDYDAWLAHLTDGYIAFYSDPKTLHDFSQYPVIKSRGIELKTLRDYFLQVVYPAHQNDKVDDIDFIDANLVKAITLSPKGDRNILYILEKHGDTWKIGIGR